SGLVGDIDLTSDDLFSLSRSPQYLLDLQQNYSNQDLLSEASSISQTKFSRKDALKRHMVVKGCDKKSQATSSTGVATNNNSNKTATSSNASKPNKKLKISSASSISLSTNNNKNTFNGN
ncbi:11158_t:CDS:2, partial [Entrophospora sp. SA101]